jgi:hypothetical protein
MKEKSLPLEEVIAQQEIIADIFKSKPLADRKSEELDLVYRQADRVLIRTLLTSFLRYESISEQQNEELLRGALRIVEMQKSVDKERKSRNLEVRQRKVV